MADFLVPDDYDEIRAALDTSLDSDILPDTTIEMGINLGIAEQNVKRIDPMWATHWQDAALKNHLRNAAILYCAAILAPSVPQMILEYFGEYRYHRQIVEWKVMAGNLRARADDEVGQVLGKDYTAAKPIMFAVASGRRGR